MKKGLSAILFLACVSLLCAQQAMNNDSVIKLIKAGMSDDVVISTVNSTAGTYDTSADGLIALKTAGVSDKVLAAVIARSLAATAPLKAPTAVATSALPPGIDEVGVYYMDKKHNTWVALMPEVVNFKTGGALKKFATNGIVKGDINGHIEGKAAKTSTTLPVDIAVYVPEGTAITEYQLLRLRQQSDSREFRSVTGGVIHSSGGESRDSVDFQSTKVAPRVYQITLEQAAGRGEYGLLPPGATSSSNMASGGKIYSFSVIE
jgi:hypothetical protein